MSEFMPHFAPIVVLLFLGNDNPLPLFFVNVASKGLSICVSRLESTVARGSQVLLLKELRGRDA